MPGPVPKRSDQRRRRNKSDVEVVTTAGARSVSVPRMASSWHPIAKRLWQSLKDSGQADFYEPSDWAFAYSLMDDLSHYKNSDKRSAVALQTIYSSFERLLVTEGDRRRARIELERGGEPEADPAKVAIMDEYRRAAE